MTEQRIKEIIDEAGYEGISDIVKYLVDSGIVTTRQKLAHDYNVSRGCVDDRIRRKYYQCIPIYKYATLIIDHERITGDTEPAEGSEESA